MRGTDPIKSTWVYPMLIFVKIVKKNFFTYILICYYYFNIYTVIISFKF